MVGVVGPVGPIAPRGVMSPGRDISAADPETSYAAMFAALNILDFTVNPNIYILVNLHIISRNTLSRVVCY